VCFSPRNFLLLQFLIKAFYHLEIPSLEALVEASLLVLFLPIAIIAITSKVLGSPDPFLPYHNQSLLYHEQQFLLLMLLMLNFPMLRLHQTDVLWGTFRYIKRSFVKLQQLMLQLLGPILNCLHIVSSET